MRAPSRVTPSVPGTAPGTKAKTNVTTPAIRAPDRGEGHALFHGGDGQLSGGQCPIRAASSGVRAFGEVAVVVGKIGQDLKEHHRHQGAHTTGVNRASPASSKPWARATAPPSTRM